MDTASSASDIIIRGKPLPSMHASPEFMLHLKGEETGGVWDGKRTKLLPHGTPALAAYPDRGGVWTIGWGATGGDIFEGVRWNILQCEIRLEADVQAREQSLRVLLRGSAKGTTFKQFEAILSLSYNAGIPTISKSTLLKMHKAGDLLGAAKQFLRWDHDNGRVVEGLTRRRDREKAVYEGGAW